MSALPQAVMFDLDGTLLDSLPGIGHSAETAFAECGLPMADVEIGSLIGPPIRTILARMAGDGAASDEELDRLERAFRVSYDSVGWSMTPHYPGATELLQGMQERGMRMFVVSNKPRHISLKILEAEGTLDFFEEIVTRDSRAPAYAGKVEMMHALLAKYGLDAELCLMIGDTMEDAEAASQTGIAFCLMAHGYGDVPPECEVPVRLRLAHFGEFFSKMAEAYSGAGKSGSTA